MRALLTRVSGAVAGLAGHAVRHARFLPGVAAAGLLVSAGAVVHPALGLAVAGVACLALDRRIG